MYALRFVAASLQMSVVVACARLRFSHSEKPPPQKEQYNNPHRRKRSILLKQQLPINPHSRLPIPQTIIPQPRTHIPHLIQTIPPIQQILDILVHNLAHISQFVVELVEVGGGARVLVGFARLLDEAVEFDEGVGACVLGEVLLCGVGGGEFLGEVLEVGEGEFARVGVVGYAVEDEVAVYDVAVVGVASVYGGLAEVGERREGEMY